MKYFKRLEFQVFYRVSSFQIPKLSKPSTCPRDPMTSIRRYLHCSSTLTAQVHERKDHLNCFAFLFMKSSGSEAFNSNGKNSLKQEIPPSS